MTFGVGMQRDGGAPRRARNSRFRLPRGPGAPYRKYQSLRFLLTRDRTAVRRFLTDRYPIALSLTERLELLARFTQITNAVRGYHTLEEMLTVTRAIFARADDKNRPVQVLEAGAGSGSSTAKLSLATRQVGGQLFVFDTFRGIPPNDETHEMLDGRELRFRAGAFRGRLGAVRRRVETYGAPERAQYFKGLFEDTLPGFQGPLDVVLLDVDLRSSTRTCIRELFGQLRPGGVMFSQDGHLRLVVELLEDPSFWRDDVGVEPPRIDGLGRDKLVAIYR